VRSAKLLVLNDDKGGVFLHQIVKERRRIQSARGYVPYRCKYGDGREEGKGGKE
jgi:hypothetical protein